MAESDHPEAQRAIEASLRQGVETGASPKQTGRLERIKPDDLIFEAELLEERLGRFLMPEFGEKITEGVVDAVKSGSKFKGEFKITDHDENGDPKSTRSVLIENQGGGSSSLDIHMSGEWKEGGREPEGIWLDVRMREALPDDHNSRDDNLRWKVYRRINSKEEKPLVEVNSVVKPGDLLLVAMRGKRVARRLALPRDLFPNGGKVTAIDVPDGVEGKVLEAKMRTICVDPIR